MKSELPDANAILAQMLARKEKIRAGEMARERQAHREDLRKQLIVKLYSIWRCLPFEAEKHQEFERIKATQGAWAAKNFAHCDAALSAANEAALVVDVVYPLVPKEARAPFSLTVYPETDGELCGKGCLMNIDRFCAGFGRKLVTRIVPDGDGVTHRHERCRECTEGEAATR